MKRTKSEVSIIEHSRLDAGDAVARRYIFRGDVGGESDEEEEQAAHDEEYEQVGGGVLRRRAAGDPYLRARVVGIHFRRCEPYKLEKDEVLPRAR